MGVLANISRLLLTGVGELLPAALTKLDTNDAVMAAAIDSNDKRISVLEKGTVPIGGYSWGVQTAAVFQYTALAAAGYANVPALRSSVVVPGTSDFDGKYALCWLSATKFVVISVNTTQSNNSNLVATIFEISAGGIAVQVSTIAFANQYASGGYTVQSYILGCSLSSANGSSFRVIAAYQQNAAASFGVSTSTITVAGDNSMTAVTDFNTGVSSGIATSQPGQRRRSYLTGTFGSVAWFNTFINAYYGFWEIERTSNSTFRVNRPVGGPISAASFSVDQISSNLFFMIRDDVCSGSTTYTGAGLVVAVDDYTHGEQVGSFKTGNAITGNVRCSALSASLVVAGWTTGSTFYSYAFTVSADGKNSVGLAGSPSNVGIAGTVPFDVVPYTATKAVCLTKGAGWLAQATTLSVDPAAAAGVNPFSQLAQTPAFSLTSGAAGAVAGDNVVPGCVERMPGTPDRFLFVSRNSTRAASVLDVYDFT